MVMREMLKGDLKWLAPECQELVNMEVQRVRFLEIIKDLIPIDFQMPHILSNVKYGKSLGHGARVWVS